MSAPTAAPILEVADLRVHFPMRVGGFLNRRDVVLKAVDGVSFALARGETLGVVGESGCGKSTLGRAVLQLIAPTGGRVLWQGTDLTTLDRAALRDYRQELQVIFQDPLASLDPRMTVGDIVAEPLTAQPGSPPRAQVRSLVKDTLARVGLLPEMINRYPHEFSGGQCQRIGIARAMIVRPQLIVCDEPVSALDVSIQAQIINLLRELQREFGLSLIFISHDLSVVRHTSHRILVLYLGKVLEIAPADALYTEPLHPYTRALISAVPLPDPKRERGKQRLVLHGDLPSPLSPPSGCVFRTRCPWAAAVCAEQAPLLREVQPGRRVACHFDAPGERAPGAAAQ